MRIKGCGVVAFFDFGCSYFNKWEIQEKKMTTRTIYFFLILFFRYNLIKN